MSFPATTEAEIAFISELFTKAGGTASKASIALPFEGSGEPWIFVLPKFTHSQ